MAAHTAPKGLCEHTYGVVLVAPRIIKCPPQVYGPSKLIYPELTLQVSELLSVFDGNIIVTAIFALQINVVSLVCVGSVTTLHKLFVKDYARSILGTVLEPRLLETQVLRYSYWRKLRCLIFVLLVQWITLRLIMNFCRCVALQSRVQNPFIANSGHGDSKLRKSDCTYRIVSVDIRIVVSHRLLLK